VAQEFGISVIPYYSLASGFLTGKYKSKEDTKGANRGSKVEKYFDNRGIKILKALDEVAAETGVSQATIALAWLLEQPTILAPIASATSTRQLESLTAAPSLRLSDAALAKLYQASTY
jgi:aryl-alcohol dehydrogenase-like predicted oxidoreductase